MKTIVDDKDGTRYHCAQDMEDCAKILQLVDEAPKVVYDAETSGLDWRHNHVVGHVLTPFWGTTPQDTYYVPLRHQGGGNVEGCRVPQESEGWDRSRHRFEVDFAKVARQPSRPKIWIGHNFGFDLRFLHMLSIILYGEYEDTMVNAPLIDENMRGFSLEAISKYNEVRLKGVEVYEYLAGLFGGKPDKNQMSNWWRTKGDEPEVFKYAGGDGVVTADNWFVQQEDVSKQDLGRVHGVEKKLIRTLHRMTSRGIRVNEEVLNEVVAGWRSESAEKMRMLPDWLDSIRAPTKLKRYFADEIKNGDWPRNPPTAAALRKADDPKTPEKEAEELRLGAPKFDEDTLSLSEKGQGIVAIKKIEHAISSFATPMLERHMFEGRVHCEFNQMKGDEYGTVTGRLSSSNPNMQQVPKRNKLVSKPYRRAFEPEEGHIWFDNDYSQQEYVVFTNYTMDPNLVQGYRSIPPVDIHSTVAKMLDVERDPTAKRMNLGMLYGMGKKALAGHLGVSIAQAVEWMNLYHRQFPYARKFLKQAEARAKNRGHVHTLLGRRRRFPDPRFAHKAGNAVIQGSSADITKAKMVEIDEYFESEGDIFALMLQCHDSLSWTGPEELRYQNDEAIRIMSSFGDDDIIKLAVPIAVDSGEGANWSEATFGA